MFEDFIRGCASDSVNAQQYTHCATCDQLVRVGWPCADCEEKRQRRDARNDAGADEA